MSTHQKGTHIGTRAIILHHLAVTCKWFLIQTLKELRHFMMQAPEDTDVPMLVLCVCDWGKHRSVGMAWFIDGLLKHLGHQTRIWHMCKQRWSKERSCGRNSCAGCDEGNPKQFQLLTDVISHWDRLFDRPDPVA